MLSPIDFGNVFISTPLNISDIEPEEDLDTDKSEEFNTDIQIYLTPEKEHKEFTVIDVNLNTAKNDDEEYLYEEDDPYFEPNNAGYHDIIQISCIYDYCIFHLGSKAINNFFLRAMFKPIKKAYIEEETRYQILTIKIAMYGTFILSLKHLPICMKERVTLKRCQEPFCLEYYLKKAKE